MVRIPRDAYEISLRLCELRAGNFQNQYVSPKLRALAADDARLTPHIEGVIGYIGDICAAIWLGIDPEEMIVQMLIETDLLQHRDECDLRFRKWRVDVKVEDIPPHLHAAVLERTIDGEAPYGKRLLNGNQFDNNYGNVDIYLFSLLDTADPRLATEWYPVGYIMAEDVRRVCPRPVAERFPVPAYAIPTSSLEDPLELLTIGPRAADPHLPGAQEEEGLLQAIDADRLGMILERLDLGNMHIRQ